MSRRHRLVLPGLASFFSAHSVALLLAFVSLTCFNVRASAQTTWYVDDDNCPGPGTGVQADPFCMIQDAIGAAANGDECVVAPGTYNELIDFLGKAITLRSSGGVAVTTIDGTGLNGSVVKCVSGEGVDTLLDGFTITGGTGSVCTGTEYSGGGMYNHASSPTVSNCTFSGNSVTSLGGGMHNCASSPTVSNCTFNGNQSLFRGGGMSNRDSSPTIANCAFRGNTAQYDGGGVNNYGSNPTVIDCTFIANSASIGGAMFNQCDSASFIYRCTFVDNHGRLAAGGLYVDDQSCPTVVLCKFFRNSSATSGGGVHSDGPSDRSLAFVGCTFYGNSAAGRGGGVYARDVSSLHLTNCLFSANSAHTGGGIYLRQSAATVTNCSFAGNTAVNGAAVANYAGPAAVIANSILWDGGDEIWENTRSTVVVTYSNVQGGWPGSGNIDADPLFVDPNGPDNLPGTEDDDLRLLIGSPATDAGDNTAVPQDVLDLDDDGDTSERTPLDLGGHARFVDDPCLVDSGVSDPPDYVRIVDMGAFELSPDRDENGIPDESEPDSDGDGTPDFCDNCPDDPNKVGPGRCGCGVADIGDDDADGVLDCVDQCPNADDAVFAPECIDAIPTVSQWGLLVMTLLLLTGSKIKFAGGWVTRTEDCGHRSL